MSIPYHIGAGYFGGFLPVIAGYIVAKTGDAYAGLWYTWGFVFIALIVGWWGFPSGPPRDFEEADPWSLKLADLPPEPPRTLRLQLDHEALAGNWRALDRLSGAARAGAAVKADGYGLGVAQVVPLLARGRRRGFLRRALERGSPASLPTSPLPGFRCFTAR